MSRFVGRAVSIRYPGGAIYVGRLEDATPVDLLLADAVWYGHTGRASLWWAGKPDDECQWERMPALVELPRAGAEIAIWEHPLPALEGLNLVRKSRTLKNS